jgi:hypothetical protein
MTPTSRSNRDVEDRSDDGIIPNGGPPTTRVSGNPDFWSRNYDRDGDERDFTKGRTGINYKFRWDQKAESFPEYERLINNHCQQHDLVYLLIPHFMTTYLHYGTRVLDKAPQYRKPGMSVNQFLRYNSVLYGILQSVVTGIQLFRTPMNVQGYSDGIRMYITVVNRLGPTHGTQKWI